MADVLPKPEVVGEQSPQLSRRFVWGILALIVLITAGLRVRLSPIPFERDEGEYAYIAQLILQGEAPFAQAYTMKYPGVPYVYALFFALFGQTDVAAHLGLLIVNAVSIVLVFLLGKKLFNPSIGLLASGFFALATLSQSTFGFSANTEHFALPPIVAATLLLLYALEDRKLTCLVGSGFLFGVAVLMKQHAAVFAGFGFVFYFIECLVPADRSFSRLLVHLLLFSAAVVFPLAALWLYLWMAGAFAPFWFWTFTYPPYYVSMVPLEAGKQVFLQEAAWQVSMTIGLYLLALVGAAAPVFYRVARGRVLFLLFFAAFSLLGICPGWLFRPHYFLLLAPALSLLAGVGAAAIGHVCRRFAAPNRIAVLLALLALTCDVSRQYRYFFVESPLEIMKRIYQSRFADMKELGDYIRDHSLPDDRMAILGSEPEMYFYARRRAATKFIYVYPMMEPQPYALQLQEQMIAEIEKERPRYIVVIRSTDSWISLADPDAPQLISQWPSKFVAAHYRRVAVADMISSQPTEYRWGKDAISYTPTSDHFIVVYERVDAPVTALAPRLPGTISGW